MSFSKDFQARLRKSVEETTINPADFIAQVESFLCDTKNRDCNSIYRVKFTQAVRESTNFVECLRVLKENVDACGYKQSSSTYPPKGSFAFAYDEYLYKHGASTVICNDNLNRAEFFLINIRSDE